MILVAHIIIAIASMIYTAFVYFAPTQAKLRGIYALTALTIGSGTWLVVTNPAHMMQSCVMGLAYLSAMFFGIALARNKLATEAVRDASDDK